MQDIKEYNQFTSKLTFENILPIINSPYGLVSSLSISLSLYTFISLSLLLIPTPLSILLSLHLYIHFLIPLSHSHSPLPLSVSTSHYLYYLHPLYLSAATILKSSTYYFKCHFLSLSSSHYIFH